VLLVLGFIQPRSAVHTDSSQMLNKTKREAHSVPEPTAINVWTKMSAKWRNQQDLGEN
jgi:hypothetical protein